MAEGDLAHHAAASKGVVGDGGHAVGDLEVFARQRDNGQKCGLVLVIDHAALDSEVGIGGRGEVDSGKLVAIGPDALAEVADARGGEVDLLHGATVEQLVGQAIVLSDGELLSLVDEIVVVAGHNLGVAQVEHTHLSVGAVAIFVNARHLAECAEVGGIDTALYS